MAYDTRENIKSIGKNLMKLITALTERYSCNHVFISVIGSGGKTSLIKLLSSEFSHLGKSVLITTTTKIQSPFFFDWGTNLVTDDLNMVKKWVTKSLYNKIAVLYALKSDSSEKWCAPNFNDLNDLKNYYDVILCEADGAKGFPLKIHTEKDPVILSFSNFTIAVMGVWALGLKIKDSIFGYKPYIERNYKSEDDIVDIDIIKEYINNPDALIKGLNVNDLILVNGIDVFKNKEEKISMLKNLFTDNMQNYINNILLCSIKGDYGNWLC